MSLSKCLFIAAASIATTGTAFAQDPAPPPDGAAVPEPAPSNAAPAMAAKKMTVGADLGFVLPFGDYADTADFGLGLFGRFEFAINPQLAITGRVGYVFHAGTPDGVSVSFIPVMAGVAYKIGTSGLFAFGELGINRIGVSVDLGGGSASDSEIKLTFGAGAGYQMNKIKARVGIWVPGSVDSGTESSTLTGILASVGYDFASF